MSSSRCATKRNKAKLNLVEGHLCSLNTNRNRNSYPSLCVLRVPSSADSAL
jgi:hypothetical protein